MIEVIGFDADDTLWHTENIFQDTQQSLVNILERYAPHEEIVEKLYATEKANIGHFGYGIKGFTLSMVETAVQISDGNVTAHDVQKIIDLGKDMLQAPLDVFAHIEEVLADLRRHHRLFMITKGDLLDQRNKIDKSGLAEYFEVLEVVSEKDRGTYKGIFDRERVDIRKVAMVGNSVPSDVLPVLELGGIGIHIPYGVTAEIERHDRDPRSDRFYRLRSARELPALIDRL